MISIRRRFASTGKGGTARLGMSAGLRMGSWRLGAWSRIYRGSESKILMTETLFQERSSRCKGARGRAIRNLWSSFRRSSWRLVSRSTLI